MATVYGPLVILWEHLPLLIYRVQSSDVIFCCHTGDIESEVLV